MDLKIMNCFLSEDNIKKHLEHLKHLKLKLSVLEKSYPQLKGIQLKEIRLTSIDRKVKNDAMWLTKYIKSHELFFNSFSSVRNVCKNIKKYYSSREKFVYDIYQLAKTKDFGFLYVYIDGIRGPKIAFSDDLSEPFSKYEPILALDLYEHTYFADYGFSKDKFLKNALSCFNIEALDGKLS